MKKLMLSVAVVLGVFSGAANTPVYLDETKPI